MVKRHKIFYGTCVAIAASLDSKPKLAMLNSYVLLAGRLPRGVAAQRLIARCVVWCCNGSTERKHFREIVALDGQHVRGLHEVTLLLIPLIYDVAGVERV